MKDRAFRAFAGGFFFSVLQFCYFILLESQLSSAWTTYAAVSLSWMAGILAGLLAARRDVRRETALARLSLAAYATLWICLKLRPFDDRFLALYALCVAVSGAHAGAFFLAGAARPEGARGFLLHENNGFLAGMLLSLLGFSWNASVFAAAAPAAAALILQSF